MRRRRQRPANRAKAAPWQRRRRRVLLILLVAALMITPVLVWRIRLRADLNERMAELRRAGMPATLEELAAWEPHDPREAEADVAFNLVFSSYREMDYKLFEGLPKFEFQNPHLLEVPYPEATRTALENRVAGNEAMLEHFLAASRFPRYRLAKQYNRGLLEDMRDLARPYEVLAASACLRAELGEGDRALDAIEAGIRVARACRATPFSEALNRAVSYEYAIVSVLPAVVVRADVSGDRVQAIERMIQEDDWMADVLHAINGDRCQQLFLNSLVRGPEDLIDSILGGRDRRLLDMLGYYSLVPEFAPLPYHERMDYLEQRGLAAYYYSWWGMPLSRTYSPVPVAVLRFYRAQGALPDGLEQLVPRYLAQIPLAASGKALGYEHTATSFVFFESEADPDRDGASPMQGHGARWFLDPAEAEAAKPSLAGREARQNR